MKITIPKKQEAEFIDLVEWYIPLSRAFTEDKLEDAEATEDQYCKARDYLADFLISLVRDQVSTFKGVELCERQ